ncbi:MAG TPA: transglutaminaseTgpA domain-containing protein [Pyrinomonadaceae bacterium]|jgi:transglutaminase-like putative cysteine protease
MTFKTFFRASSFAMVGCGALALAVSGSIGPALLVIFAFVLVLSWKLEGWQLEGKRRWQLSERVGLAVVLLSLPLFYLDWKFLESLGEPRERVGASALAHLTLFLSAVKLLQSKADRDWVFLYLISFFEVLLAAGLSLSPTFLITLCLYMLCGLCTVLSFEISKAQRGLQITETRLLVATDSTLFRRLTKRRARPRHVESRRLPVLALALLLLIFALALPLFLAVPRFGASAMSRMGTGLSGLVGFSDSVTLGDIGTLQKNSQVVMRVRVDDPQAERHRSLRWRGVALDEFTGKGWKKSKLANQYLSSNNERGMFQFGTIAKLSHITTQTFFIEPIDTPVLFAAPRPVAVQGALPYVRLDHEDSIQSRLHNEERISYKAYSDTSAPDEETLRRLSSLTRVQVYPGDFTRYLQFPRELNPRIGQLAREVLTRAGAHNRYDAARAIESHLQHDYGYTLDLKAGGADPLADFLFRVREGHCEYFATAMAVMLRTQGIPTRVVNGFQMGEYNDAADVYTVTQSDAHSWVEVYFPEVDSWVTFDPTPPAGRPVRESAGLKSRLGKYAEALDMLWIQYVIGYDRQEQRSLATSMRDRLASYRQGLARWTESLKATANGWWNAARGQNGLANSFAALAFTLLPLLAVMLLAVLAVVIARRVRRLGFWRGIKLWEAEQPRTSVIEFYERMTGLLAARGLKRASDQTPLEFATATRIPEALMITRAYNRVRFGEEHLSTKEAAEINQWLSRMEGLKQRQVTGDR